jgi:hypothetical protein
MPTTFSAATCLTSSFVSPGPFNIYLTDDYTSTPFSSVTKDQLTLDCPFIFNNIPEGTTTLYVKDVREIYCFTIPIQGNICQTCNLGLSNYSATTITRLSCGFLTGSCQNITDYVIHWYGPNDTTTLQKRTGFGSVFSSEYDIPHPFLGNSSIPLPEGFYTPIIQKVIVSGLTFSNTGGTNSILFDGNCLPTTTIEPLTCSNRTNTETSYPKNAYSHNIYFESTSGIIPQSVNLTYVISSTTKFMAIAFKGLEASDRLTLTFSGSNYGGTKIGLEDVRVGTNLLSNFTPTIFPKSANTQYVVHYYTKIICLTGLTVSNNDKILIDVTPFNNVTTWDLFITCLDDYTCNDCLRTQPYKIIKSSITGITKSCNQIDIKFQVSGCPYSSLFLDSDYTTYYLLNQQYQYDDYLYRNIGGTPNGIYNVGPGSVYGSMYFSNIRCDNQNGNLGLGIPSCKQDTDVPGGRPTSYSKSFLTDGRGVFKIIGSSTVISDYYRGWTTAINSTYSGSTNPLDLDYYNYVRFIIPDPSKGSSCADAETGLIMPIHIGSSVITGITGSDYYFSITANTITNGATFTNCDLNCNVNINSAVDNINNNSTGTTNNYGNYTLQFLSGKYFSPPIPEVIYIKSSSTVSNDVVTESVFRTYDWMSNTLTFSGSSTLLPSLSGTVCNNYSNQGYRASKYNSFGNSNWKFVYKTVLINPSNVNDFEILASPITNFVYSGAPGSVNYELAYRYSGGVETFSNPTYII